MDDESSATPSIPASTPMPPSELTYEETPVITPVVEPIPETPQSPQPKRKLSSLLKNLLLLVILFIVGYVLSGVIRNALNTPKITAKPTPQPTPKLVETLTENIAESSTTATAIPVTIKTTPANNQSPVLKFYSPVNGLTRAAITTIQLKLPDTVLAPICDGSACGSQGTYLPGGTRLTIAPRGVGQVLPDFRGKIISDAGGKTFITKQTTIGGKQATDFSTADVGSTVGGYAFSTMHGVMIEVSDTLSLELNHFAPSGITADFASDDALFNQILASIVFSNTSPTPTATMK